MSITLEELFELKRRRDELFAQLGDWAEVLRILREEYNRLMADSGQEPLPVPVGPIPPAPAPLPIPELPLTPVYPPGFTPPGEEGPGAGEVGPGVLGIALVALLALSEQGGG